LSEHVTSDEPYLLVEEVAERLGLPLSVLLHRVEAGDIPARRVERADGLHYALRLGDLGIELDDRGLRSAAIEDESAEVEDGPPADVLEGDPEDDGLGAALEDPGQRTVESAIFSAFDSGPAPIPGRREIGERPWEPAMEEPPPWSLRPREPQEPPVWLTHGPRPAAADDAEDVDVEGAAGAEPVAGTEAIDDREEYLPPAYERDDAESVDGMPALAPAFTPDAADDEEKDQDTAVAELAVPPPGREPVSIVDAAAPGPRGDLASMSLDARELVAGLLDRWERTLEQRIYTEQRQRFQAELVARQNMVKQLQMELHTARAEHAAAQAEKDRLLAGKERELADRERDLADTRRLAEEAERIAAPAASRRRRWFWNRDD
jgi:hypothetical protein